MKTSLRVTLASFSFALVFAGAASAQENQSSHGGPGSPPPPVYTAPPPGYGGGYTTPNYAPAPPPPYGPKKMRYEEGSPVPPGYRVEERARTGLVVGGACLFGVTYLITALIGSALSDGVNDKDAKWMFLPVVGPFVYSTTTESATAKTWLYIDGLAQAGGVAMFIIGIAGQKMLIRNDVASRVLVTPMVGKTNGLSLIATF